MAKPTWRLSGSDRLSGLVEWERGWTDGLGARSSAMPEATRQHTATSTAWNLDHMRVLSPTMMLAVKYAGLQGSVRDDPYKSTAVAGWYDEFTGLWQVNAPSWYLGSRARHKAAARLSSWIGDLAGSHAVTIGTTVERSRSSDREGYSGGGFIMANAGRPYGRYFIEPSITEGITTNLTVFAQDDWSVARRLTVNAGVRLDWYRGATPVTGTIFRTHAVAPRLGVAFDLLGDETTVLRAHYGAYADHLVAGDYDAADPRQTPWWYADIDFLTLQPVSPPVLAKNRANRTVDRLLRQPLVQQATAGIQRELARGWSIGATAIYRKNVNLLDDVLVQVPGLFGLPVGVADPGPDGKPGTGDETGTVLLTYSQNQQTQDPLDNQYLITNPAGAYSLYRGVQLDLRRRMRSRWMLDASWVISKTTGNSDTDSVGPSVEYDDPNVDPAFQPFRTGRLARDHTHIVKLRPAVEAPFGMAVAAHVMYVSGGTYTRTVRVGAGNRQPARDMFVEPRGSRRLDGQLLVAIKVSKHVTLDGGQVCDLSLEGFNLLNSAAITERDARSGSSFGRPLRMVSPRQFRVGATFRF